MGVGGGYKLSLYWLKAMNLIQAVCGM